MIGRIGEALVGMSSGECNSLVSTIDAQSGLWPVKIPHSYLLTDYYLLIGTS